MEHESNGDTNFNWCSWNCPQMLGQWTRKVENRRRSRDHPKYSSLKIGQNTEKSSRGLRRLAVTPRLVKDHQLTKVWKTRKDYHNNDDSSHKKQSKKVSKKKSNVNVLFRSMSENYVFFRLWQQSKSVNILYVFEFHSEGK